MAWSTSCHDLFLRPNSIPSLVTAEIVQAHGCSNVGSVSICYKPSLFNAHTMILIVHIFMNVNKLCLNQTLARFGYCCDCQSMSVYRTLCLQVCVCVCVCVCWLVGWLVLRMMECSRGCIVKRVEPVLRNCEIFIIIIIIIVQTQYSRNAGLLWLLCLYTFLCNFVSCSTISGMAYLALSVKLRNT